MPTVTPALAPIRLSGRGSRAEQVYDSLRGAILEGRLAPGTPLPEKELASVTAVSRTPVREALHRLEIDGLVESNGRGMVVIDVSAEELVDLCIVRETMDGLAARLAAGARSDLDVAVLEGLHGLTREAADAGDLERLIDVNHAFHETIWQIARNRFLRAHDVACGGAAVVM